MDIAEHSTQTALITAEDAAALKQARIILRRLYGDATTAGVRALRKGTGSGQPNAMDYGAMRSRAEMAEDAIFNFLNVARHDCDEENVDFEIKVAE